MHAIGIVCEYNPFHLGHLFHIEMSRQLVGEDVPVICVMSGDFVQRGEAAVFQKAARAEAACSCGADLVLELPLPWCLSSAEGFAGGAVSILQAIGCTDLSFGSETDDLRLLKDIASFLLEKDITERIRILMKQDETLSFARARQTIIEEHFGPGAALLSQPNSVLAVEYLKAIYRDQLPMNTLLIPRQGNQHDSKGTGEFRSAMQLREMQASGEDITAFIPKAAGEVYERESKAGHSRNKRILETAILSRLYSVNAEAFDCLPDADGGAGRRLYKAVRDGYGIEDIVKKATTRRYTAARMRRMLLCAAFGVSADDSAGSPPYIRVLAANERGRSILRGCADNAEIPIVGKTAAVKKLGQRAESIFRKGADAHALYRLQFAAEADRSPDADWRFKPYIV